MVNKNIKKTLIALLAVAGGLTMLGFTGLVLLSIANDQQNSLPTVPAVAERQELKPSDINQSELLEKTNQHRKMHKINALRIDSRLNKSAAAKCKDMVKHDYWEHNAPDGTQPWAFIRKQGVSFRRAGENLAYGFRTARSTVDGWKASRTHNDNMLDPEYTHVGFGVCKGSNYLNDGEALVIVQHFAAL